MKLIIRAALILLNIVLIYLLVMNIKEPIAFQTEKTKRKDAVVEKLMDIRESQEMYRRITGEFAHTFDTLVQVLENDSIVDIKEIGDIDAGEEVIRTEIKHSAIDSLTNMGISLKDLDLVPFSDNVRFNFDADTITYQSTLVSVVEVGTKYSSFMGKFADNRYKKYDNSYDPQKLIKFGDMEKPNIAGNWEN